MDKEKERSDKKDKEDKSPSKSMRVRRLLKSTAHAVASDISPKIMGAGARSCEADISTMGIINGVQGNK